MPVNQSIDPQLVGQSVMNTHHPVVDRCADVRVNKGLMLKSGNTGCLCKGL